MGESTPFLSAVARNRVATVKRHLEAGERPDLAAVFAAIQHKANDVLAMLLKAGVDLNVTQFYYRYTPLVKALECGNLSAFKLLLKAGASPSKLGAWGGPLHYAAMKGLLAGARLSLRAGAKVGQRGFSGNTPLMLAASNGHLAIVRLLVKAGANPLTLNRAGKTACELAAENEETKVVEFLAPLSQRRPPVKRGVPALLEAVAKQDMAALEKWLAKGVDVNATDRSGRSALDVAIGCGSIPTVRRLLKAGIDLNKVDRQGISALEKAVITGQSEVAKELLKAGAHPNNPRTRSARALATAAVVGDVELAKLLVNKGSSARGLGALGVVALMHSAKMIRLLLAAGADPNETDHLGKTPLFSAVSTPPLLGKPKRFQYGGKRFTVKPATAAEIELVHQSVQLLIEHGADVNHTDPAGRTPLTFALWPSVAKLLIEAGARLDIRDKLGHTVTWRLKKNGIAANSKEFGL